jgi:hypothetical protein
MQFIISLWMILYIKTSCSCDISYLIAAYYSWTDLNGTQLTLRERFEYDTRDCLRLKLWRWKWVHHLFQKRIVILYHLLHNCYILAFTSNNANGISEYWQPHTFMSTMRCHWLIYSILLLYINRSSLSHNNKVLYCNILFSHSHIRERRYDALFVGDKKGRFVSLFLSLSFTFFQSLYYDLQKTDFSTLSHNGERHLILW